MTSSTMPKFEPVAFPDLPAAVSRGNLGTHLFDHMQMHLYAMRYSDLHAGQLTEAYEAGKREASEYIEQAAFEKWLYDKCPSGDVESMQRQWLESYEYAEFAGKMEQAAQINHLQMALADTEALEAETSARCLKQAAQIELMREVLNRLQEAGNGEDDNEFYAANSAATKALSTTPDQALEQFAAKSGDLMRERIVETILASANWFPMREIRAIPSVTPEDMK